MAHAHSTILRPRVSLAGMRRHSVLFLGCAEPAILAALERFFAVQCLDGNGERFALREHLADKAALISAKTLVIDATDLHAAPMLRAICSIVPGATGIDLAACTRAGVMVTDVPQRGHDATSRLTMSLIAVDNLIAAFGFGRLGGHPKRLLNTELRCLLGCCL